MVRPSVGGSQDIVKPVLIANTHGKLILVCMLDDIQSLVKMRFEVIHVMEWTGHSLVVLNGILALPWGQRLDFSVLEIVGSDEAIVFLFLIIRKIKSFTVCGNEVIDMANLIGEIFPFITTLKSCI